MLHEKGFRERIATEEELRMLLGSPSELVARKVIPYLDQHCRDFIARAPFLVVGTANAEGACDVSPRGDAPGFVLVLDDHRLVIPERPGNRRIDSLRNILANPHIGLIFMIPGLEETLRINGRACVVRDPDLLGQMEAHGRTPLLGIGVEVVECYVHCAKAFKRSQLWQPDAWPERATLPSIPQMLADHVQLPDVTAERIEQSLRDSYTKRLY